MTNSYKLHPLIRMLICLTLLFILWQISLFFIHANVSNLVDTLINSSVSNKLFYPVILFPVLQFILIQIVAYVLLIIWMWFITISIGELFSFSNTSTCLLGFTFWIITCSAILSLNNYFYPDSFFSALIREIQSIKHAYNFIALLTSILLIAATLIAYINVFIYKRHLILGSLYLIIMGMVFSVFCWDHFLTVPKQQHDRPNIILIGLDSVRPDYIGYFNSSIYTPNITQFFQSSMVFNEVYTPLARTFPTWMSILTGKYPMHNAVRNNLIDPNLVSANDFLTKHLKLADYETIYASDEKRFSNIIKAYGFDRVLGPKIGVDDFLLGGLSDFPLSNLLINIPGSRFLFPFNFANRAAAITYKPNSFLQLIKMGLLHRDNKPTFLAIHLCLSHWPYAWASNGQAKSNDTRTQYVHSIEALDAQLGQLFQLLKNSGMLDNSLVFLFSDHGTTLGTPNERSISSEKYLGDHAKLKLITVAEVHNQYTINTTFGQGNDVLSLRQYQAILALRAFGKARNLFERKIITDRRSLADIAPTILTLLKLSPMQSIDGISLFETKPARTLFIETGDKVGEVEKDNIVIEKVIKERIGYYDIDPTNGMVFMNPNAEQSLIKLKQRAILWGDWLLARYPAEKRAKLVPEHGNEKNLVFGTYQIKPYYVLLNLTTGYWTIGLSSPLAKSAPLPQLLTKLNHFYDKDNITSR